MFTEIFFIPMILMAMAVFWSVPARHKMLALTAVNMAVIGFWDIKSGVVCLILAVMVYALGKRLKHARRKKAVLGSGVAVLIVVLVLFKYLGFLEKNLGALLALVDGTITLPALHLFVPLGVSFYIFRQISYLVDVYWGVGETGTFPEVYCHSALFTLFAAGPIERFRNLQPQFRSFPLRLTGDDFEYAMKRIALGLFMKMALSDWIGVWAIPAVTDAQAAAGHRFLGLLGYSLHIYLDFAGYSSMAIGFSRLLGLRIMENFHHPYFSPNISVFWQRWHISLSSWIRDYVFFPLSSISQRSFWRLWLVPLVAMGLCGLWHGAAWKFLLWGVWHGLGIAVYQAWQRYRRRHKELSRRLRAPVFHYISMVMTFLFVTLGWVCFL